MEIVILSVPHTGTNFCKRLFRDLGWEDVGLNERPRQKNAFYTGHVLKQGQIDAGLELSKSRPLLVPFRHPFRVEESWRRHKRDMDDLIPAFKALMDQIVPKNPYFMPVDSCVRELSLKHLSDGIGVPLKTTWEVIGSTGTAEMEFEDFSPSEGIRHLADEMKPLLDRWY